MREQGKHFRSLFYALLLAALCVPLGRAQESDRKVVKKVEVQYPPALKSNGIGGVVRLRVTVKPDGTVKDVTTLGGSAALADAATESVRRWRFVSAEAESTAVVVVKFDPNSPNP